jgi:transketolase
MTAMRTQAADTVCELFAADPRVAVVLAEISVERFQPAFEHDSARAVNIGIMEQAMVGVAAGFAMEGFLPVAHSLSPFMAERPYEQLKLDFGYQGLGGTFVGVGGSYDYGTSGATHHAPADVGLMLGIPRMEVLIPGHGDEVERLLRATYANGSPTYIRASVTTNEHAHDVAPGRLEVLRRGDLATVIAFGPMLDRTIEAAGGLDVTIAYATSLRPFDDAGLVAIVGDRPVVVSVEPFYEGSAAPALTRALSHLSARFVSIGVPRGFIHGYGAPREIDRDVGLDTAWLGRRLRDVIGDEPRASS